MPEGCGEREARAIVEWVLGGVTTPLSREPGRHFQLVDGSGAVGTLSVRAAGTPRRLIQPSLVVPAPALARSWLLYHPPSAELLARVRTVVDILADLDAAGVRAIGGKGQAAPARGVLRSLAHHGISRAVSLDEDPGQAVISFAPPPSWLSPGHSAAHLVNDVVEDEAWADADARRRDGPEPGDRHLFLWLDPTDLEVRAAMEADRPPAPPVRPGGLDVVWVARRAPLHSGLVADRIWQTGADGEWETLAPVRRTIRPLAVAATPG